MRDNDRADLHAIFWRNASFGSLIGGLWFMWSEYAYASHGGLHITVGTSYSLGTLVLGVINYLALLIPFVCLAIFVVGALFMIVGSVKEEQRQKGKTLMIGATVGLVVVLSAYALLRTAMFFLDTVN